MAAAIRVLGLLGAAAAQRVGTMYEEHPPVPVAHCTDRGGCVMERSSVTLDANSRWAHVVGCDGDGCECYNHQKRQWNATICKDPWACAQHCVLEGANLDSYANVYGIAMAARGVEINVMESNSRVYMLDANESAYKIFKLKNREFAFDVDVSKVPCGLNAAVYFVEMSADGERSDSNKAGAKYGTGYCDAQCPRNVKFLGGKANVPAGHFGHCCTEVDVWEANRLAEALTVHPCSNQGSSMCEASQCGGSTGQARYSGACDPDGCSFGSLGLGHDNFFGLGDKFAIDTTKPMTVVTQWLTTDGTDHGELTEIRRIYMQNGKVVYNWNATNLGPTGGSSVTDQFCAARKKSTGAFNDFSAKGGLRQVGAALDRGMVLVMSLWSDPSGSMPWLDAGADGKPCLGHPTESRKGSAVKFSNFMYGEIGSALRYRVPKRGQHPGLGHPALLRAAGRAALQGKAERRGAPDLEAVPAPLLPLALLLLAPAALAVAAAARHSRAAPPAGAATYQELLPRAGPVPASVPAS